MYTFDSRGKNKVLFRNLQNRLRELLERKQSVLILGRLPLKQFPGRLCQNRPPWIRHYSSRASGTTVRPDARPSLAHPVDEVPLPEPGLPAGRPEDTIALFLPVFEPILPVLTPRLRRPAVDAASFARFPTGFPGRSPTGSPSILPDPRGSPTGSPTIKWYREEA